MNDVINILLADPSEKDQLLFQQAFGEVRIRTNLRLVQDDEQLMSYLNQCSHRWPHVVFIDINLPVMGGMDSLMEIRGNQKFRGIVVALYAKLDVIADDTVEEAFVNGANIFLQKPDSTKEMQGILSQIVNLCWQYHTSGLKKENFLLNIRNNSRGNGVGRTADGDQHSTFI